MYSALRDGLVNTRGVQSGHLPVAATMVRTGVSSPCLEYAHRTGTGAAHRLLCVKGERGLLIDMGHLMAPSEAGCGRHLRREKPDRLLSHAKERNICVAVRGAQSHHVIARETITA